MSVNSSKNIFISGAARGIGKACALLLDGLGYRVFAGVRREQDAAELKSKTSSSLTPVIMEITDTDSINLGARQIGTEVGSGGLYGLVNNAGIVVAGPLEFIPLDLVRRQFEVNFIGHLAVTQALMPLLRKGGGRVINISSKEGIVSMPYIGPYCASKFALEAFSNSLRMELKPWNMPVSVIEPGTIATEIIQRSIADAEECIRNLPKHANDMYESCFNKARQASDRIASAAIPVESVARIVAKALADKKPRTRYTVGIDARALAILARLLPDWMLDKVILGQLGMG